MVLVHRTSEFQGGLLVCAIMYLMVGLKLEFFSVEDITGRMRHSSGYLIDDDLHLNHIFAQFVKRCFKAQLIELLPFIQYAGQFFSLNFDNRVPKMCNEVDKVNVK